MRKFLGVAALCLLAACSSTQLTQAESDANAALNAVTAACAGAQTAETTAKAVVATTSPNSTASGSGPAATVANVSSYVDAACGSAAAIVAVAQNPTTVAWLNGLNADLTAAVATAPAAASPATGS